MSVKLLLTGGAGFVGENIIRQSDPSWEIHVIDQRKGEIERDGLHWHVADLLDDSELKRIFAQIGPDVAVHTAAISDIDTCEAKPELAERVNVGVTSTIAALCREHDTKMIYFSTDSIFDGEQESYRETDPPTPLNVYAKTKVDGERIVMTEVPYWVIVRPSLVMGLPVGEVGNSFLWKMIQSAKKGESVAFPKNEIRTPVNVITLSRSVLELAGRRISGHFHLSGNDSLSRFDMAVRICRRLGYPAEFVVDKKPTITTGRARRPENASLSNAKANRILKTPMMGLEEGLDLVIENRGTKEL
ncbi:MAG TPA: NAD(P)-dependent oxidoreductase [Spirochaetia bacterium]|nr:NAD(P)-dependent oxidoreductase [Spirochaetia bacterium]